MRKAIIVGMDITSVTGRKKEQARDEALSELNQHLADGWDVINSVPLSTGHVMCSASIIILEKA